MLRQLMVCSQRFALTLGIVGTLAGLGRAEDPAASLGVIQPTVINTSPTALDAYVAKEDPAYKWEVVAEQRTDGGSLAVLSLTSQTWRSTEEVDRVVWQHWLTILRPDSATTDTALLFITGGANGREAPTSVSRELVAVAQAAGVVVAELKMVPNQPLVFGGDGEQRVEDNIIGYSWDKFLQTGDLEWPAQLPMTKSAVRGMDATQEYLASEAGGNVDINKFVVAGASKRGWTTWLTAAVDDRVAAIAPIVIDVLNVNVSMRHHYSAYGFWAPAIDDYVRHRITERRFLPEYRELLQIVDPFAYRDRLTMPKCIINATGDQFFLPDSSQFYFAELGGEKHLSYVPNADHSLRETNAIETLASFAYCVARGIPRPNVSWEYKDANTIVAKADRKASKVVLWRCDNPSTRDFRVDTIGKTYRPSEVAPGENGEFEVHVETPEQGWRAYFLEFTFDVGAPTPLRFTTPVQVIPVGLPYSSKEPPVWEKSAG